MIENFRKGRPHSDNPSDTTIRIRAPRLIQDRLRRVAQSNKRGAGKQALVAIEKHLDEEEQRLGLYTYTSPEPKRELRVAEDSQSAKINTCSVRKPPID